MDVLVSQVKVCLLPDDHRGHVIVHRWSCGCHRRIHTQAIAQIRAHWVRLISVNMLCFSCVYDTWIISLVLKVGSRQHLMT